MDIIWGHYDGSRSEHLLPSVAQIGLSCLDPNKPKHLSLPQIPSRGYGLHLSPRVWNDPGPRLARHVLLPHCSEEMTELPRGKNVAEGYFASLAGAPLVPVMESADLRYRNNGSAFRWVHGPRFRRVLSQ